MANDDSGFAFATYADFFGQLALVFAVCVADPTSAPPLDREAPPTQLEANADAEKPDERTRVSLTLDAGQVVIDGVYVGAIDDAAIAERVRDRLGPAREDAMLEIHAAAATTFEEWHRLAAGLEGWERVCVEGR